MALRGRDFAGRELAAGSPAAAVRAEFEAADFLRGCFAGTVGCDVSAGAVRSDLSGGAPVGDWAALDVIGESTVVAVQPSAASASAAAIVVNTNRRFMLPPESHGGAG